MTVLRWLLLLACLAGRCPAQSDGDFPGDPLASAHALFKLGKFSDAAAAYRAITSREQPPALAFAGLVRSYLKADDVAAAEESSVLALAALPHAALVHAIHGDVLFRQGLMEDAALEYKAALRLDDKCARAWFGMGRMHAIVADKAIAKAAFARAHELDPDDSDIIFRWAVTLPYPRNVAELDKFMVSYHSDAEDERHKHEYLELVRALAGRRTWVPVRDLLAAELKLEAMYSAPGKIRGEGLRVRLNGSRDATLLFDTGASGVMIYRKLAEKIGAKKLSNHTLEGIGDTGPAEGYVAWVDRIRIGDLEFQDCPVLVSARNDTDTDGTIGGDVFSHYLVTIDFPARRIRLGPLPPDNHGTTDDPAKGGTGDLGNGKNIPAREGADFTPYFGFGHLLLLPTRVESAATGLFAVDTGAGNNLITPAMAKHAAKPRESQIIVHGISGQVKRVQTVDHASLEFSHTRKTDETLLAVDLHSLSKDLETELSGIIGYPTLNRMKVIINYRDGTVRFE